MDFLQDESQQPWESTHGLNELFGPHQQKSKYPTKLDFLKAFQKASKQGKNIILAETLASELNQGETAVNMIFPQIIFNGKFPCISHLVVVAHPLDAERIARLHVKKSLIYMESMSFLGQGVLSTSNLESWSEQRSNLVEGFLPLSALANIMPISVRRAKFAVLTKLNHLRQSQPAIDMNEFFLFEAMAQLHLALLGETEEFSDANNVLLRQSFAKAFDFSNMKEMKKGREFVYEFSNHILNGNHSLAAPYEASQLGCPVLGPVAAKLKENTPHHVQDQARVRRDTASTISFAGFDTTANLMTWFTFEMCRRPELQRKLQEEIDSVYDELQPPGDLSYHDLSKFSLLTKYINETLRLWTSVPNGTFREIQFEGETIEGRVPGSKVPLPKGTQVWIPSWLLHRSELLWGKDALEFNPHREWLPEESWFGRSFSGTNPSSYRYAPFTFPPRGCIGMNFAQMEARVILSLCFRFYSFAFAEPTKSLAELAHTREHFLGNNVATMGPMGGMHVVITPRFPLKEDAAKL